MLKRRNSRTSVSRVGVYYSHVRTQPGKRSCQHCIRGKGGEGAGKFQDGRLLFKHRSTCSAEVCRAMADEGVRYLCFWCSVRCGAAFRNCACVFVRVRCVAVCLSGCVVWLRQAGQVWQKKRGKASGRGRLYVVHRNRSQPSTGFRVRPEGVVKNIQAGP
jgi:hypothetical protein